MARGDPRKPKGKISAYAFFVQTCREERKKKSPEVPVNLAEFSKKCSERWNTMSGKEKSKFDEMAKVDKVRYDREMKDYGPAKGGKKKKDPNAPKRPPSGFFLFCSEFCPKIRSTNPGISIGDMAKKLGQMWNNLNDSKKQPYITKAAKLKEKYEKDVAHYKSKGKFDGAKGPPKVARKKVEEEDEEDRGRGRGRETIWTQAALESPEGAQEGNYSLWAPQCLSVPDAKPAPWASLLRPLEGGALLAPLPPPPASPPRPWPPREGGRDALWADTPTSGRAEGGRHLKRSRYREGHRALARASCFLVARGRLPSSSPRTQYSVAPEPLAASPFRTLRAFPVSADWLPSGLRQASARRGDPPQGPRREDEAGRAPELLPQSRLRGARAGTTEPRAPAPPAPPRDTEETGTAGFVGRPRAGTRARVLTAGDREGDHNEDPEETKGKPM
ncbi:transcription factor SOX-30-like [Cebus imitator]|uniref:transcription factor SOX-30-like n=1 Tax=Cebus imitator TaxID=2715852 RepID=UPI000809F077|nr:transcription factor SOX-30-like [Cebus imitator]